MLYDMMKNKKTGSYAIYDWFTMNLPTSKILILDRTRTLLIGELETMKSNSKSIDLEKQLIANQIIPENIKQICFEKINEMNQNSQTDSSKQHNYVKLLMDFPWPHRSEANPFTITEQKDKVCAIQNIKSKLIKATYGHAEAKDTILQLVAKWYSNPTSVGESIGFEGPPGVGKTMLAQEFGKAIGIPVIQINLGGQNDGELLHGHGYTYSGSGPGMVIRKLIQVKSTRCILYFDELDKTGAKNGGSDEIKNILIHMTDPNSRRTFQDRFFQGIDFPIDQCTIVFSYNDASNIDPILLDRLIRIQFNGYDSDHKIQICRKHLIPCIMDDINNKSLELIDVGDQVLYHIIQQYTQEAGVRSLKRILQKFYLTLNLFAFEDPKLLCNRTEIGIEYFEKNINIEKIRKQMVERTSRIGRVYGLYASGSGTGGVTPIQIEPMYIGGDFQLKLTGSQGKVMKESVECALNASLGILRLLRPKEWGGETKKIIAARFPHGFHIHAPEAGVAKDGPSAGIAFGLAFVSIFCNLVIPPTLGMTGEIDLYGNITKIGGLQMKLNGAKEAGIKTILISQQNIPTLDHIKRNYPKTMNGLKIHTVSNLKDVLLLLFPKILEKQGETV